MRRQRFTCVRLCYPYMTRFNSRLFPNCSPPRLLAEASLASRHDSRLYGSRVVASWAMARLNRRDEARQALVEARRIRPHLSLGEIKRFFGARAAAELDALWN